MMAGIIQISRTALEDCLRSFPVPRLRLQGDLSASDCYVVSAIDGCYELCIAPMESAVLRQTTADWAAASGFRRVQRPLQNLYDERLVPIQEGRVAYLTRAWPGLGLAVTPDDVRLAAENLAFLHSALDGAGARLESLSTRRPRYGAWLSQFQHGLDFLERTRVHLLGREDLRRDQLQLDWLARWQDLAEQAVERLRQVGYRELAETARQKKSVAWNGYHLNSLRRLPDGQVATLLTADPVLDDALYDLACLCRDVAEAGHAEGVADALTWYHGIHPLSREQAEMVRAFAAYPHLGVRMAKTWSQAGKPEPESTVSWRKAAESHHDCAQCLLAGESM
ncbi:MAG: hypothetical protein K6T63_03140 [Alicyclobacillus herbarius]|uniref:hypothetical protein n=1 Tax=Alicyclobacillus herbarius TaxID=122960 RepID=UPI0023574671|nr:hypothetical protein [Alicyclobacillus herbarius]MCL6631602.1 hypothetical protein [Alicyclobacillus herbarius]